MSESILYKKLKGSAYFSLNRLYIGTDHLLSSKNNLFTEGYQRFYYKDIQSFINRKTVKGKVYNICLSSFLVIFILSALFSSGGWAVFFYILSSVLTIFLLVNLINGPTSICHIQTPVQTVRLSAINRIKRAEKAIAQVKPLIENSQGILDREVIMDFKPGESSEVSPGRSNTILRHESGQYHQILFFLLTASALFLIPDIFKPNIYFSLLSLVINLTISVYLVIALKKQVRSDIYVNIKIMAYSIIGYLTLRYIACFFLFIFVLVRGADNAFRFWELIKDTAATSPLDYRFLTALYTLYFLFSAGIGISGIILTAMFRKKNKSIQAASSVEESTTMDL